MNLDGIRLETEMSQSSSNGTFYLNSPCDTVIEQDNGPYGQGLVQDLTRKLEQLASGQVIGQLEQLASQLGLIIPKDLIKLTADVLE